MRSLSSCSARLRSAAYVSSSAAPAVDRLLGRARQLVAEANEPGALLLALSLQPLGVGGDPRLGLGDELLLAMRELARAGRLRAFCARSRSSAKR